MPTLESKIENLAENPPLLRMLFYGSPKTKKTWLAGTAAEAGFNTILLDSDHGYQILLKTIAKSAHKRLQIIEARDSLKKAQAAEFIIRFLKLGKVNFNESTRTIVNDSSLLDDDCIHLSEELHLNANTVLIIDSYTAIIRSIATRYAIENKIDVTKAEKTSWDGYASCGILASWILNRLTKLPCHVVVIGHKSVYEKHGRDKQGKDIIEWTRQQIKSTSGPHSMTICDLFSDILYFENISSALTKISTRADKDMDGGSRLIPPNIYNWDKLQFKDICAYAGITLPDKDLPYLDFSVPESEKRTKKPEKKAFDVNAKNSGILGLKLKKI